jgi:methylated-DNA-protein-cysteine methyltransferase-like protein
MTILTKRIIATIMEIPEGSVATYGQIGKLVGHEKGARQVSWTLRSQSNKYNLPWHRIINSVGKISIQEDFGAMVQQNLLEKEGVIVSPDRQINLEAYLWHPTMAELAEIDARAMTY